MGIQNLSHTNFLQKRVNYFDTRKNKGIILKYSINIGTLIITVS